MVTGKLDDAVAATGNVELNAADEGAGVVTVVVWFALSTVTDALASLLADAHAASPLIV
jgi:hypothetical protein